jgi:hypothetical protein
VASALDTGGDTITGFDLNNDTIQLTASNVVAFIHGTHTGVGSGTTTTTATGAVGEFTKLTGLVELGSTTSAGAIAVAATDVALTFSSLKNSGVAVSDMTATGIEAAFEATLQYSITGTAAANTITGGGLADTIDGNGGADSLTGGAGDDVFSGAIADFHTVADTIAGGTGTDTLTVTDGGAVDFTSASITGLEALTVAADAGTDAIAYDQGFFDSGNATTTATITITGAADGDDDTITISAGTTAWDVGGVEASAAAVDAAGEYHLDNSGSDGVLTYYDEVAASVVTLTIVGLDAGAVTLNGGALEFTA